MAPQYPQSVKISDLSEISRIRSYKFYETFIKIGSKKIEFDSKIAKSTKFHCTLFSKLFAEKMQNLRRWISSVQILQKVNTACMIHYVFIFIFLKTMFPEKYKKRNAVHYTFANPSQNALQMCEICCNSSRSIDIQFQNPAKQAFIHKTATLIWNAELKLRISFFSPLSKVLKRVLELAEPESTISNVIHCNSGIRL